MLTLCIKFTCFGVNVHIVIYIVKLGKFIFLLQCFFSRYIDFGGISFNVKLVFVYISSLLCLVEVLLVVQLITSLCFGISFIVRNNKYMFYNIPHSQYINEGYVPDIINMDP